MACCRVPLRPQASILRALRLESPDWTEMTMRKPPARRAVAGRRRPVRRRRAPAGVAAGGIRPLAAGELRWRCDPQDLPFDTTDQVEPIAGVIGQDAAVDSLRFGLETNAPGQHIFVRGLVGVGRMTLIRRLLEEIRLACPEARDRCYVRNFSQPDRPRLITLPRGRGRAFAQRIEELADFMRTDLRRALSSETALALRRDLEQQTQQKVKQIREPLENALQEADLALISLEGESILQLQVLPRIEGRVVSAEEFEHLRAAGTLPQERYDEIRERVETVVPQLRQASEQINEVLRAYRTTEAAMWRQASRSVLAASAAEISAEFPGDDVQRFLNDIVDDFTLRRRRAFERGLAFTRLYGVNVVLAHDSGDLCPIIIESTPTMANLLGAIEMAPTRARIGRDDHMRIRAGSLLRADGGYLIMEARDVLREPGAWQVLVRTLRDGRLDMVPSGLFAAGRGPSIKPEPIGVNVKVILLGEEELYYLLDSMDHDCPQLFKVLADFASSIPRNSGSMADYARALARIAREERLLPFDRSAIAALIEHGARVAGSQNHLTTRFGRLADIAREAVFLRHKAGGNLVDGADVREAVHRTKRRADLPSRHFSELVADGTIRVETEGAMVGQINGLAVLNAGPLAYGFPARITATIGPGTAGVINIEREAALSGAIHTKGFYILGGLLRNLLRTLHPLAFDASVAFEQSYGEIDGDSASGAEICCLLSALTEVPIRQDLAMTGAIDQLGHVLAVGAVNEKIEGFFDVCQHRGLSGTQGVVIPRVNASDLMLREDVVESCASNRFHVYAVDTVHEAIECLTGVPAGQRDAEGWYPEDTLLGLALKRAWMYWLKASQQLGTAAAQAQGRRRREARAAASLLLPRKGR